jgi:hypothetical protein
MWHEISTAPFNRDLELTVGEVDGSRTIAFLRMLLRSQLDNCFLLCGMRNSGRRANPATTLNCCFPGLAG